MDLRMLRRRVDRLAAVVPANSPADDAVAQIANVLARIDKEVPPGRSFLVLIIVRDWSQFHEPAEYAALLEAVGSQRLTEAFGDEGPPKYANLLPILRRRAREWRPPAGYVDPLTTMLKEQIARGADSCEQGQ